MIPEAKREAVTRALQKAFGATDFEDLRVLTAGLSTALVCRIVVQGCPYLLRIITRTDAMGDPTRQFACMKSAAEAGLAPRVWYTSVEDRVMVTDFVDVKPFSITEAGLQLPRMIRAVHALPPFARAINHSNMMEGFIQKFKDAKILPESEELLQGYAKAKSVYPQQDSEMVSSHNDLKPENILFDGARAWFVDWEAAFLNDRYCDLAVVANFVVTNDAEESAYLQSYFGEPATEYVRARFYLMQQILHTFYAAVFLLLGSAGKAIEPTSRLRSFREFNKQVWNGEISLAGEAAKVEYGRVHMNQALENMSSMRFHDALRIVSECQEISGAGQS